MEGYYTLGDLLGHWEHGELTLEEVVARWPRGDLPSTNEELLRDLLRMLMVQELRLVALERSVNVMRKA